LRIGRGIQSTRRTPAPASRSQPRIPDDLTGDPSWPAAVTTEREHVRACGAIFLSVVYYCSIDTRDMQPLRKVDATREFNNIAVLKGTG
jgi:hypothetical protein